MEIKLNLNGLEEKTLILKDNKLFVKIIREIDEIEIIEENEIIEDTEDFEYIEEIEFENIKKEEKPKFEILEAIVEEVFEYEKDFEITYINPIWSVMLQHTTIKKVDIKKEYEEILRSFIR
jgi:hypothetical protein